MVKFEHLLSDVNGFGRFQIMILVISFISRFTLPCHFMLGNFIAAVPAHHCDFHALDDGGIFENLTQRQRLTVSVPVQEDGTPSSCEMFPEPQINLLSNVSDSDLARIPCQNGWVYDNSTFKSTIATEWDLVCDQKGQNKLIATIFFIGVLFGSLTFGSLSDRFGRKPMLLVSYLSGMLFGIGSAFSTSFIMFAVLRFFTGFSITGIVIVSSVLSVEWVDIEHRKLVGVLDSLSWTLGNTLIPAIAYGVTEWRRLTIAVTSPLALAILTWRWIPESARWLIANGKFENANDYLQQCAQMNKRKEFALQITPETLSNMILTERTKRTYSYMDLVGTPKMRTLALRTGLVWYGVASTYYGISFNITGFGLNIYLTQFLYGAIEMPAKLSVYYLLDRFGRRNTEVAAMLGAGVCLAINIFIPREMPILRTAVAVLGKACSAASFATVVLYCSELFPTVIRQNGMGYNSSMGRLGVSLAPLILLLDEVWRDLPQVILCSIALVTGLVARMLPETRGRCLPETIEDIENRQTRKTEFQFEKTSEIPLKSMDNDEMDNGY